MYYMNLINQLPGNHVQDAQIKGDYQQKKHSRKTKFDVYSFFVGIFFLTLAFVPKYNYSTDISGGTISNKRIFEMKTEMYDRNYFVSFLDDCSSSDIFAIKLYANFYIIVLIIGVLLILKAFTINKSLYKITEILSIVYMFYLFFIAAMFGECLSVFLDHICYCEANTHFINSKKTDIGIFLTVISGILFLKVKPTKEAQMINI